MSRRRGLAGQVGQQTAVLIQQRAIPAVTAFDPPERRPTMNQRNDKSRRGRVTRLEPGRAGRRQRAADGLEVEPHPGPPQAEPIAYRGREPGQQVGRAG